MNPGETTLKATLAWDDPPAAPNVVTNLVNDLELRVYDPAGGVHFPWTLDLSIRQRRRFKPKQITLIMWNRSSLICRRLASIASRLPASTFHRAADVLACASPRLAACSSKGALRWADRDTPARIRQPSKSSIAI